MHRTWKRLCLIGAGIVWMTAAGCQEGNQEEPLLEEVEEIREEKGMSVDALFREVFKC